MWLARSLLVSSAALAWACGSEKTETPPPPPPSCASPELALPDGNCIRPGVMPDGCAEGFAHDGEYGCEPVLPDERCAPPLMAIPGDVACRSIMPCGDGTWGDIPVDAGAQYVDGSFQGGNSDGSSARPWITIAEAVAASSNGGLVAVASGSYVEDLTLTKAVRIWGVCPERVELAATAVGQAAILLLPGASGAEIRGLAIGGPALGIALVSAQNVTIDRVWIHDTGARGIGLQNDLGPTSAWITGSLVSNASAYGISLVGASATIEDTVVLATRPDAAGGSGRGIAAEPCIGVNCGAFESSHAQINRVVIDGNRDHGVVAIGSELHVDGSVITGTLANEATGEFGRGVAFQRCTPALGGCPVDTPSPGSVTGSLVANNVVAGIAATGSDITVERTVARDNVWDPTQQYGGEGLRIELICPGTGPCLPGTGSSALVRSSLIENNQDAGILSISSTTQLEDVVVRGTRPSANDYFGRGVVAQTCGDKCSEWAPTTLDMRRSLVDDNHEFGVVSLSSTTNIDRAIIRGTKVRVDGLFGDGVAAMSDHGAAVITVVRSSVADSHRAGIASFGATVTLASSSVRCAPFELTAQDFGAFAGVFDDAGSNHCGCPEANDSCQIVSEQLEPPVPLPDG